MIPSKHLFLTAVVLLTACAPHPTIETNPNVGSSASTSSTTKGGTPSTADASTAAGKTTVAGANTTTTDKANRTADTASRVAGASPAGVSSWEISGAMAARNKSKGWSASLNWVQNGPGQYQIRLSGPLGSGTVLVNKKGGVVTLRDGPKTASSSNADELLRQQTGVRLPVNNLYYWVRGLPAPGAVQSAKKDQANHLTLLRQSGYTIEYTQYTTVGKYVLPSQIRLQGNGVFIKVVIRRWRV
ncbi:molecular chaperone LolB [Legionella donaldsonii]|uniref:Outer-membrane lipoprotein LolB n=1 Tax=Legionella donaldsonii TaxID=45060 RepID=A0A378JAF7_9GAMM|nr:lipoprotein insertase outer membrane protein LolB [Legionella donaldsonii]STX44346.1 molecular chaperone LolB [Legionella donaldsonii]